MGSHLGQSNQRMIAILGQLYIVLPPKARRTKDIILRLQQQDTNMLMSGHIYLLLDLFHPDTSRQGPLGLLHVLFPINLLHPQEPLLSIELLLYCRCWSQSILPFPPASSVREGIRVISFDIFFLNFWDGRCGA